MEIFPVPKINAFYIPLKKVKYDDIVRKDNYRPDSENKRDLLANGNIPTVSGLFDSEDGKKKPVKFGDVSLIEVGLREGRFNKEDLSRIKDVVSKKSKSEASENEVKAKLDKAEKLQKQRDSAIDSALGVSVDE